MPDRFVLGVAYQAGPDPRIRRGADGSRDYFNARELELASRTFMRKNAQITGLMHVDGTEGHAEVVESYIYRNPAPWLNDAGEIIAKQGDWMLGAIVDETTWDGIVKGEITGWSPQGTARRIRPTDQ